jgi:hypothetical protein
VAIAAGAGAVTASLGAPPALQAVMTDAAKRTGSDARSVRVVRTEQKDWPDSSLGCPRAGEMYMQMITPGWLIEVQAGQRLLEYHTDAKDRFVLCSPAL